MLPVLIAIVAFGAACVAYGVFIERTWFVLRAHRVPCLPAGAAPIRVLHISDLHFRPGQARKRRFLARCARTDPDLLVGTGDYLGSANVGAAAEAVTQIRPKNEALYVLGSNDYYASKPTNWFKYLLGPSNRKGEPKGTRLPWRDLVAALDEKGWKLINNTATSITLDGLGAVDVVGLDDPHLKRHDITVASARAGQPFRLAVVHSPDAAPDLAKLGYDLILCGHTHGGQVRIPVVGALVTNSTLPRSMARGVHRLDGAWLHVSAGMGTSPFAPFRFGCRPEACVLELVPRS